MDRQEALRSHAPFAFASTPSSLTEASRQSAARLLFRSHWNLNTESARDEPRLRRLLGHMSVYDRTKELAQSQIKPASPQSEANELSSYIAHQVPSFEEFRAALRVQLETITQVRLAAAAQCKDVDEYDSDGSDDSDYDSYDGEWSDEDDVAESDDSLTDNDESESQVSACTSPTFEPADGKPAREEGEEDDIWAIRPLTPILNSNRMNRPS
jgi:hypothetical protein